MPYRDRNQHGLVAPADLAADIFESLARQFPVCMASDEFHYFPQAVSRAFDWRRWDDFSPGAVADIITRLKGWEGELQGAVRFSPPPPEDVDRALLLRSVRTLREQLEEVRVHESQPTFYLTIAGIGLAEAYAAGAGAFDLRLAHLPAFFEQAVGNLSRLPRLFRDLGAEMLAMQHRWLRSLALPEDRSAPVQRAYERLGRHLEDAPVCEEFLPSADLYERIARNHMGCGLPPADIARELALEKAETQAALAASSAAVAPGRPWQAAVANLPPPARPSGGAGELYARAIGELARHCVQIDLVPSEVVEACPVRVEGIPDYMRPVRSNAAFSMPPGHPPRGGTFFILDTGPGAAIPPDYRLLSAHETYPGHHLLDTCRWRHPRPVRRHLEFPVFYEGWASFAEELLFETGFFGGAVDRLLMAKRRFWRALRGQVDFDLHVGRRSPDGAAALLVSHGLPARRAEAMVHRYCLKPGYQLAYTIGRRRFRRLWETFRRTAGDPVAFARRVLAQGEIGFDHLAQQLARGG
mgnify:CR=1 FL=1